MIRQVAPEGGGAGISGSKLFLIIPGSFELKVLGQEPAFERVIQHLFLDQNQQLYFGGGADLWRASIR